MTARFRRGLVAVALTMAISTAGTAQPAAAQDLPGDIELPPPGPALELTLSVLSIWRGGTVANLAAITEAAIALLRALQDDVNAQNEWIIANHSLQAADSRALQYLAYEEMLQDEWFPWQLSNYAFETAGSAQKDVGSLRSFTNRRAMDAVGFALSTKFPIALQAAQDAGLPPSYQSGLEQRYIEANQLMIQKLEPTCHFSRETEPHTEITTTHHLCIAANGETATDYDVYDQRSGTWLRDQVNVDQLKVDAAIHSSWVVALEVLPELLPQ